MHELAVTQSVLNLALEHAVPGQDAVQAACGKSIFSHKAWPSTLIPSKVGSGHWCWPPLATRPKCAILRAGKRQ